MSNSLIAVFFSLVLIICISISQAISPIIFLLLVVYAAVNNQAALIVKATLKIRWILLALVLIVIFNEPGEIVVTLPFGFSPTYEGLYSALYHAIRLVSLMMVVSLMTLNVKRHDLISAFYQLLAPLSLVRCNLERFSARLCLTLEYVQAPVSISHALTQLGNLNKSDITAHTEIELAYYELSLLEFLLIFIMSMIPFLIMHYQL